MKAWQYTADNAPIIVNEVAVPVAAAGEVVLDVKGAGICHTDIGHLDGSLSSLLPFRPITLGHEVAGVVSQLGEGVTEFAVGDRVAVLCTLEGPGTGRHGGFQPKIAVQAELLVRVPDSVPWDQAAVSTDAGATSYHAVVVRGNAKAGENVGIIGFGGLGALGAQAAVEVGANVYVAEIDESLHQRARESGAVDVATHISDFKDRELGLIVDFAGFGTTTAGAVEAVKPGGRVVQVGLGRTQATLNLLALVAKQVDLLGSLGGTLDDHAKVLELMGAGKIRSTTIPIRFQEVGDAIGMVERGEASGRFVVVYD
jgi:alcohol dehydrogenase, propanol-preferring